MNSCGRVASAACVPIRLSFISDKSFLLPNDLTCLRTLNVFRYAGGVVVTQEGRMVKQAPEEVDIDLGAGHVKLRQAPTML